ncbi:MAG: response regulator [Betaproteobacteria bacterium]
MKLRFWGTRGSIATPGEGTIHFGGNTSCVEVTTAADDLFILDCGTGAHRLGASLLRAGRQPVRAHILFGHTHWDHIQGFPFFGPAFAKGNSAAIYGPEGGGGSLRNVLSGQMEFRYFPVELEQLPADITFHPLTEGVHSIGGASVAAQFLHHPAMTLGYRIEADGVALAYLVDHEPFSIDLWRAGAPPGRIESILHEGDRRHAKFMAGADVVVHDAQYTPEEYASKKTWGHSPYDYVVKVAAAAGVRCLLLTHHDPGHDDRAVADIERRAQALARETGTGLEVLCAYEGFEREIAAQPSFRPYIPETTPVGGAARVRFRILVVDDQPDTLSLVQRALDDERYVVVTAKGGGEALALIGEDVPDLVVLDYRLADIDGLAIVRALRARPETRLLPLIMLTEMADERSTRACFDAGVTDYLTKPFSIPQLTTRVRACLSRAHG